MHAKNLSIQEPKKAAPKRKRQTKIQAHVLPEKGPNQAPKDETVTTKVNTQVEQKGKEVLVMTRIFW